MDVYGTLRDAFAATVESNGLAGRRIGITCRALAPVEAIGNPEHADYPILKGKEVMVEATFEGARGQAFSGASTDAEYVVEELPRMALDNDASRASFVAGLNAVYRHLGLCEGTVHCRDAEPKECAGHLMGTLADRGRVLLVGQQPRFLETLAAAAETRAVDLDPDNIGTTVGGVTVEPPENTADALRWCDVVFATGSTLVNGSIAGLVDGGKPVVFYGVTVAAAATILGLERYCRCGH